MTNYEDMEYKGFKGSVHHEEDYFYGEVNDICGVVLYEGETLEELHFYFKEAVDDYLKTCEKHKVCPYTGKRMTE